MIYLTHFNTAATSYVEELTDIVYPQKVHWFPETFKRVKTGLFFPAHRMAEKVMDETITKWLRENPVEGKTAFIFAAGSSSLSGSSNREYNSQLTFKYKFLPFSLAHVYCGRMAQGCGKIDMTQTDSSACASSLKVMMDVENLIKNYGFDRVIVVSFEDSISDVVLEFFGECGASLTSKEESHNNVMPSAFDSVNRGFYVGQGSVFSVFHSERAVTKLHLDPLARLVGAYVSSEQSTNAIGQCEDGEGFSNAINGVCFYSKTLKKDINIVKAHGTGTLSNNKAEKAALLNSGFSEFVATSYKQKIGHTLGASGLLETCLLLDDLKSGFVPEIKNRTEEDSIFLSKPEAKPDGLILSLAAGMGNIYAAAIFEDLS
jgi:3-oxoacyl-(acyl-carrier-protein) synthase